MIHLLFGCNVLKSKQMVYRFVKPELRSIL